MARIGQQQDHSALDKARQELDAALHRVILLSGRDEVLPAIERFIDAKIEDKRNPRY